jgi:hypothetical protein
VAFASSPWLFYYFTALFFLVTAWSWFFTHFIWLLPVDFAFSLIPVLGFFASSPWIVSHFITWILPGVVFLAWFDSHVFCLAFSGSP